MKKKKKTLKYKLVMENINNLLKTAILEGKRCNVRRAEQLGSQARKLAQAFNVRLPRKFRYFYCKKCKRFLIPGKTMIVRVRQNRFSHIAITCLHCKSVKRIPIKK